MHEAHCSCVLLNVGTGWSFGPNAYTINDLVSIDIDKADIVFDQLRLDCAEWKKFSLKHTRLTNECRDRNSKVM